MGDNIQRAILPIPDQVSWGLTTYDAKDPDTRCPPIRDVRPPAGAPNVLVILLGDVGFGAPSAFGGRAGRRCDLGTPVLPGIHTQRTKLTPASNGRPMHGGCGGC